MQQHQYLDDMNPGGERGAFRRDRVSIDYEVHAFRRDRVSVENFEHSVER